MCLLYIKCLLFISKYSTKEKECIVIFLSISIYCVIYGNFYSKSLFSVVVSGRFLCMSSKIYDLDINKKISFGKHQNSELKLKLGKQKIM